MSEIVKDPIAAFKRQLRNPDSGLVEDPVAEFGRQLEGAAPDVEVPSPSWFGMFQDLQAMKAKLQAGMSADEVRQAHGLPVLPAVDEAGQLRPQDIVDRLGMQTLAERTATREQERDQRIAHLKQFYDGVAPTPEEVAEADMKDPADRAWLEARAPSLEELNTKPWTTYVSPRQRLNWKGQLQDFLVEKNAEAAAELQRMGVIPADQIAKLREMGVERGALWQIRTGHIPADRIGEVADIIERRRDKTWAQTAIDSLARSGIKLGATLQRSIAQELNDAMTLIAITGQRLLKRHPWPTTAEDIAEETAVVAGLPKAGVGFAEEMEWVLRQHPEWQTPEYSLGEWFTKPKAIVGDIIDVVPFIAAVGAAAVTGGRLAGFGMAYLAEGEHAYEEAKAGGATETQAKLERRIVGTINGLIELTQWERFVDFARGGRKALVNGVRRSALRRLATGAAESSYLAVTEGFEEVLQAGVSELAAIGIHGKTPDWREWADQSVREFVAAAAAFGLPGAAIRGGRGILAGPRLARMQHAQREMQAASEILAQAERGEPIGPPAAAKGGPDVTLAPGAAEMRISTPAARAGWVKRTVAPLPYDVEAQPKPTVRERPLKPPAEPTAEPAPPPAPTEKTELARQIAEASRPFPLEIVEVRELKGSNGKWYRPGGFPSGVTSTGETRVSGYGYLSRDGTLVGQKHPTAEAARIAQQERQDANVEEFYQQLLGMSPKELERQRADWLKGEEPPAAPAPVEPTPAPAPTAPVGKPALRRRRRKLLRADQISDFQVGRDVVVREGNRAFVVDTKGEHARQEVSSDVIDDKIRENLRKLNPAQLDRMYDEIRKTPYLSPEGKQERLDFIAELRAKPAPAPAAPAPPVEPAPAAAPEDAPDFVLADKVQEKLQAVQAFDGKAFFTMADEAYGGTRAEGKYLSADAYDAMELGANLYLFEKTDPTTDFADQAKSDVAWIERSVSDLLPTETIRSEEKQRFQQFSTPPAYAYVATWAANIAESDVVLEPSAGTGSLVVHAQNAGARVYVNEISERRAALLDQLGPVEVFTEDAEQIDNILPDYAKPTVVVMNPPFSRAGARMGDKQIRQTGARHVEQALKFMQDGGRLVAIVGRGMSMDAPSWREWWGKIRKQYNVRANIGVSGDVYKKYGTQFGTRLVVIDKTGPTTGEIVTGDVANLAELVDNALEVRNARTGPEQQPPGPGVQAPPGPAPTRPGPVVPVRPPTGAVGPGKPRVRRPVAPVPGRPAPARPSDVGVAAPTGPVAPAGPRGPRIGGRPGAPPGPGVGPGGIVEGPQPPGVVGPPGGEPVRKPGPVPARPPGAKRVPVAPTRKAPPKRVEKLTENIFEPYAPSKVRIAGAQPHPASIVESAAMATVNAPDVGHVTLSIPQELIDSGAVSDIQLEGMVYCKAAHSEYLPTVGAEQKVRRGWMLGDGAGVGKGRLIAAIILDNFQEGRQKAVWMTKSQDLLEDANRDWTALGQDPKLIFNLSRIRVDSSIKATRGLLWCTYDTMKQKAKKEQKQSRLDQIVEWLGEDFDGVIVFDEAHMMGNVLQMGGRQGRKPSARAVRGLELQGRLPNARIVYATATAATEVSNFAYADRLGLWGRGTPFTNKLDFISKIQEGGVGAMEVVAQDMKAMGMYLSRHISYNDGTEKGTVKYRRLEHKLSADQTKTYDTLADAWQIVIGNVEAALEATEGKKDRKARRAARGQLWGAHLHFFNQIVTAMQVPSQIKSMEKDLAEGKSVVIQLVNTLEASQTRAKANLQEGETLEDLDLTPRDALMDYIKHSFPVQQYETYIDENGNERSRPVTDAAGNPVLNHEAVEMRERLLDQLGSIKVPDSPLDMIINHFGVENVAEVTGRKVRYIEKLQEDGSMKRVEDKRSASANRVETSLFMARKKRILLFSDAGGTGRSYQAALEAINQQMRSHYLLQPGYRAENAIQGLGRTHRAAQAQAPEYTLMTTDLPGQRRFISTIARRLDQLGALTKGQRQAGATGIFSAADNLESQQATEALHQFYEDLARGEVAEIGVGEFEKSMGLTLISEQGGLLADLPPMSRFLNRILSLRVEQQHKVFEAFDQRLQQKVELAASMGTLDVGIENYRADQTDKIHDEVVYTQERTGAETRYVRLNVKNRITLTSWEGMQRGQGLGGKDPTGYFVSKRTGKVHAVAPGGHRTDPSSGRIFDQYRLADPEGYRFIDRAAIDNDWDHRYWREADEGEARDLWQKQMAEAPEFREKEVHVISGVMLPIWDRLRGRPKIYRFLTGEGEMLLGRIIPAKNIAGVLKGLGAKGYKPDISPAEAIKKIATGDIAVELANGWSVRSAFVGGERRIEIVGPNYDQATALTAEGVFIERIGYKTRFFIPLDNAEAVFTFITEDSPIAGIESRVEPGETQAEVGVERIPVSMPPADTTAIIAPGEIVAAMEQEFGVPIRVGHMGASKYRGFYKRKPEIIRQREAGDISNAAHEVAHHLDKKFTVSRVFHNPAMTPVMAVELRNLDYDQEKRRTSEGFAEFMRLYLSDDTAADEAPGFYEWFVSEFIGKHPEVGESLARIRGMIDQWREQGAEARVAAQISKTGRAGRPPGMSFREYWFGHRADRFKQWLQTRFVNELTPLENAVKEIAGEDVPYAMDPAKLAATFNQAAGAMAHHAVLHGIWDYQGNKLADGIAESLAKISPDELPEFVRFIYARHAIDVWARGKNPGISIEDARWVYQKYRNVEHFLEASDKLTAYTKALVTLVEKAGRLSPESAQRIRDAYPHYIPLQRIIQTVYAGRGGGKALVNVVSPVKRLKGSGRQIKNPLESIIAQTYLFISAANKTMVARKLVELADSAEGFGRWITRIPPQMVTKQFALSQIKSQLKRAGLDLSDADMNVMLSVTGPAGFYRGGEPIAVIYRNGKAEWYEFDKDLYRAIAGLDYYRLPAAMEATFGKATRAARMGITGLNPEFTLRNLWRDLRTFMMQTENVAAWQLYKPIAEMGRFGVEEMRRIFAGIQKDPFVNLWKAYGGEISQPLGLDRHSLREALHEALASDTKRRALNVVQHPVDFVREVLSLTEAGGRIAEFKAVLNKRGWTQQRLATGERPPLDVIIEACRAASEVTVDFKRAGTWVRPLNRMFLFLNPQVQGVSKFYRTFKAHPARTLLRGFIGLSIPALYLWWRNHDEDWYKELPAWDKYGFEHIPLDEERKYILRIPIPFEFGMLFSSLAKAAAEASYKRDPEEVADAMKYIFEQLTPDPFPALLGPGLEATVNWDFFRSRPIVPERLETRLPKDQATKWNTEFAKTIGEYINYPPAKIDHLMREYTGGLLTDVARQTEAILAGVGIIPPTEAPYGIADIPAIGGMFQRGDGRKSVNKFYEKLRTTEQEYNSARDRGEMPEGLPQRHWRLSAAARAMGEIRKQVRDLADDKTLAPGQIDEKAKELYRQITATARRALQKPALGRYVAGPEKQTWPQALAKRAHLLTYKDVSAKRVTELVNYLRASGVTTLEQAEQILRDHYWKWSGPTKSPRARIGAHRDAIIRLRGRWPK